MHSYPNVINESTLNSSAASTSAPMHVDNCSPLHLTSGKQKLYVYVYVYVYMSFWICISALSWLNCLFLKKMSIGQLNLIDTNLAILFWLFGQPKSPGDLSKLLRVSFKKWSLEAKSILASNLHRSISYYKPLFFSLVFSSLLSLQTGSDRSVVNSSFTSNSSSDQPLTPPNLTNTLSIKSNDSIIQPSSGHRYNNETALNERLAELRQGLSGTNGSSPLNSSLNPITTTPNLFVSTCTTGTSVSSILSHTGNSSYAAALSASHPNYSTLLSNGYYISPSGPYLNSSVVPPPLLYSHLCSNRGSPSGSARPLAIESSDYSLRNVVETKLNVKSSDQRMQESNSIDDGNRNSIVRSNHRRGSVDDSSDNDISANTSIFPSSNGSNNRTSTSSDSTLWRPY